MPNYACDNSAPFAPALRQLIAHADPRSANASLAVHPDDDMYAFSVGTIQTVPLGAMAYFRAGISINDTMTEILEWKFGDLGNVGRVLDFAAGYGRSTRFLVEHFGPERVRVGEIQAPALAFQAREFGVRTMQSATDPLDLPVDEKFSAVFVASLFTHLPARSFGPWLRRLWDFVEDDGLFIFSIHDEAINNFGIELDEEGFAFIANTEVSSLSTDEYGANFTTESFVRRKISEWIGEDEAQQAIRLPRALCFMQDVWVICRGSKPAKQLQYECGPSGSLDAFSISGRNYKISGWAGCKGFSTGDQASHVVRDVAVYRNGQRLSPRVAQGLARPDVAEHLGRPEDPTLIKSGWEIHGVTPLSDDDVISVIATCEHGRSFVLDAESVEDLLSRSGNPREAALWKRKAQTARRVAREQGVRGVLGHSFISLGRELEHLGRTVVDSRMKQIS